MPARRLVVSGLVQGVWYRAWTVRRARALGLDGWVRNLANGDVEILASGPDDRLDALAAACREGPRAARVANVAQSPAEWGGPAGFHQADDG